MDTAKKIVIMAAIGLFVFYLLGAISGASSHPQERQAPYAQYYRNK